MFGVEGFRMTEKIKAADVEQFIIEYSEKNGYAPSMQDVADGVGVSKSTAYKYINQLVADGAITYAGTRSITSTKTQTQEIRVPVLGSIACGIPKFAEENIEFYIRLPVSLFGHGHFFILRASGESMIDAGIDDGDLVLIKYQNYANAGQIVVALVGDDATLKRYFPEPKRRRIRLHPENSEMDDLYVKGCDIQGIAVTVFKDLE